MDSLKFIKLSSAEKKKLVKAAVRGANADQKRIVDEYRNSLESTSSK